MTIRANRADVLADRIRQRLQAEPWEDGQLFMTAEQLASEYQVSRAVARDAVTRLQALGLLEGRKRKGLVVRRPDPVQLLSDSLPSLAHSEEDWRELAQLRYALEVGAIELAVLRATGEQLARLEQIIVQLEQALVTCRDPQREIELDVEFHTLILQMTGSRLISGMQQVLVEFFRVAPHGEADEQQASRILWEHRELYHAIRDRDVERARALIRLQFRTLLDLSPPAGSASTVPGNTA